MLAEIPRHIRATSSLPDVFYVKDVLKSFSKFRRTHKKHLSRGILSKKHSQQFRKIRRKTPVLESLSNKVDGLKACNIFIKRL